MPNEDTRDFDGINAACRALQEKCELLEKRFQWCNEALHVIVETVVKSDNPKADVSDILDRYEEGMPR
jgi:hypothetical protein